MFGFVSENKRVMIKAALKILLFVLILALFLYCLRFIPFFSNRFPGLFNGNYYTASELSIELKEQAVLKEPLATRGTEYRINLDGEFIPIDEPILSVEGRTYLPLRALGDLIGAKTYYDIENGIGAQKLKKTLIETFSGSPYIVINKKDSQWVDMDNHEQRAFVWYWNSRLYLPLRQVCETLGLKVEWDGKGNAIYLTTKGKNPEIVPDAELTIDELIQRMRHIVDHDRQQEAVKKPG